MSSSKSRNYKSLTLAEKVAVIREVEKGLKKKSEVANDFGILPNTLSTYLKNKEKILSSDYESRKDRKRYKASVNQRTDDESKVEEENYENNDNKLRFNPINKRVTDSYQIASDESVSNDQVCIIRYDGNTDEYMIGSTSISWDRKRGEIYLGKGSKRIKFPYTSGLVHLLMESNADENKYMVSDLALYKQILEFTVSHLHDTGISKSTPVPKYRKMRSMFQSNVQSEKYCSGETKKKYTNSTVGGLCFEDPYTNYSGDPNELVERLVTLYMSYQSDSTGVETEIRAIEEKLAEEGYIQLDQQFFREIEETLIGEGYNQLD